MLAKGLKINKTKAMVSESNCSDVERTRKWLCAVCGKSVISNCVQFRASGGWVCKWCSGVVE